MTIERLEITKCNRFKLSSKEKFVYTPDSHINLIIGKTGIGKSTVLEYMSIYPIDKKDFRENGYRELTLIYNGSRYVCNSNHKGRHSISKDDEEKNHGLTRKGYLEYIEEEFGLSLFVYKLITNKLRFTKATLNDRKTWLNMLATIDMDFAYNLYDSVRSQLRDYTGAVKIYESKILELNNNRLPSHELEDLESEKLALDGINSRLMRKHYINPDMNLDMYKVTVAEYNKIYDKYMSMSDIPLYGHVVDMDTRVGKLITRNNSMLSSIPKVTDRVDSSEYDALKIKLKTFTHMNKYKLSIDELKQVRDHIGSTDIMGTLYELSIREVPTGDVTERMSLITTKMHLLDGKLSELHGMLNTLTEYKNADDVECPKCAHTFKVGYSDVKEKSVLIEITDISARLSEAKENLSKLTEYNNTVSEFKALHAQVENFVISDHVLKNLCYGFVTANNYTEVITVIDTLSIVCNVLDDYELSTNRLRVLDDRLKVINETNRLMVEQSAKMVRQIERRLSRFHTFRLTLSNVIGKAKLKSELRSQLDDLFIKIKEMIDKREEVRENENKKLVNLYIDSISKDIEDKLEVLNKQVVAQRDIDKQIKNYELELKKLRVDIERNESVLEALSPKDGLIRDSIHSYLGAVLNKVNGILSEIFDYDIHIQIDNTAKFDYKFQLVINDKAPIPDVSMGSSGQLEVIDLAFQLATYSILDYRYPLFLDEVGNRLDPPHRLSLIRFIKEYSEYIDPDLFIVSHLDIVQIESLDVGKIKLT